MTSGLTTVWFTWQLCPIKDDVAATDSRLRTAQGPARRSTHKGGAKAERAGQAQTAPREASRDRRAVSAPGDDPRSQRRDAATPVRALQGAAPRVRPRLPARRR